jgi:allophanate hydrolase subunit 2
MNRYALAATLINETNPAVIELLHGRITLRAVTQTSLTIVGQTKATVNDSAAPQHMVFMLHPGDFLTVASQNLGPIYIAISGLQTADVLGSASYDTLSTLGTAPLTSGTILTTSEWTSARGDLTGRFLRRHLPVHTSIIRYIPGPHAVPVDLDAAWTVTAAARSGVRLRSTDQTNTPGGTATLASLPVTRGVIQLPPDGNPIILGPDSGVTGGYPVAGVVIDADLHLLATLQPGTTIRLTPVSPSVARSARRTAEESLRSAVINNAFVY